MIKNGGLGACPKKNFSRQHPLERRKKPFFAKYNIVVFIINLHAEEEKLVVDRSYTLYTTSVNYWETVPLAPPVSTGLYIMGN